MNPVLVLRTALSSLGGNKLRAGLTLLGIVIGVASVIAMMAVGRGAQVQVTQRIQGLGTDLLTVRPGSATQGFSFFFGGVNETLTLDDMLAMNDRVLAPDVRLVAAENSFSGTIEAGRENTFVSGRGVTSTYLESYGLEMASGRGISPADLINISQVTVLGSSTAEALFGQRDPVGTAVRLLGREFLVVGVLKPGGSATINNPDESALVPITTAYYRLSSSRGTGGVIPVNSISVLAANDSKVDSASRQVGTILRLRHELAADEADDFTITTQQDTLETLEGTQQTFVILLAAIASISLVVGGIGIMNIMLVSVTERTREIGIRRAVGAKRRDIMLQFVTEAVLLSVGGGLVGVGVGAGLAVLLDGFTIGSDELRTVLSASVAALALLVSAGIGLFFGIYPAARAAALDPIQALRHE